MTPTERLKAIGAIFDTVRKRRIGYVSTNAYYNLLGAQIDLKRMRKPDKVILHTIEEVLTQLAKIGRLLEDYTDDPTRKLSAGSMTVKNGRRKIKRTVGQ